MRRLVGGMLERAAPVAPDEQAWRAAELGRLADDPARYPWQSDLPAPVAAVFAAECPGLAQTWAPLVNPVELLFESEETPAAD
jgi:hypothetical protein